MPLPDENCPPLTPPETCCDTLALIGDRIRSVAFEAVLGCVTEACDRPYRSYLTFGPRIEDVLGDSLIVSLTGADEARTRSRQGMTQMASVTRATYRVELRENGWPQARVNDGRVIEVPDAAVISAKAFHAIGHGERMWKALVDGASIYTGPNALFPRANNHHILQGGVQVGALTPIGPQAYQVAWAVTVTVDTKLPAARMGS